MELENTWNLAAKYSHSGDVTRVALRWFPEPNEAPQKLFSKHELRGPNCMRSTLRPIAREDHFGDVTRGAFFEHVVRSTLFGDVARSAFFNIYAKPFNTYQSSNVYPHNAAKTSLTGATQQTESHVSEPVRMRLQLPLETANLPRMFQDLNWGGVMFPELAGRNRRLFALANRNDALDKQTDFAIRIVLGKQKPIATRLTNTRAPKQSR